MTKSVLLLSLYELGRQSFGIASAAAFLEQRGARVRCQDLAIDQLDNQTVLAADLIGIHLPMHTATRIAVTVIKRLRVMNPAAQLCCFGLYAPLNARYLTQLGVHAIIGGEFEEELIALYDKLVMQSSPLYETLHLHPDANLHLPKLQFHLPQRRTLPPLNQYAWLDKGDHVRHVVGYTETTRGCRHLCRHCPVVPIYDGALRIVQKEIVLADIRQQVAEGAQHITFGDPDFLNGPGHSLPIVEALHDEFPDVTYDVTIKVEHLLEHASELPRLKNSGCIFIISAVESFDNHVLERLAKGHTYRGFLSALEECRKIGIWLQPTFVAFHPWLTLEKYVDFLHTIAVQELVEAVAPIQYAIRLLIPAQSRLLELDEIRESLGEFDEEALAFPWEHDDPRLDSLHQAVSDIVQEGEKNGESRREIFGRIWSAATELLDDVDGLNYAQEPLPPLGYAPDAIAIPRLSEHWYC